jgi:hypothetical protein
LFDPLICIVLFLFTSTHVLPLRKPCISKYLTAYVFHWPTPAAVIAPTKSVSKVKLSNSVPKANFSTSPALSPEQPGPSIPSVPTGSDVNNEVITPFDLNKDENSKVEKSTPNRVSQGTSRRASVVSASTDDNTNELRSLLISVLSENPKGMNLKVLSLSPPVCVCGACIVLCTIVALW